jgi:hypothetical protein
MSDALAPRLILYHKQATSARTRFVRFADSLLAFAALPPLSVVGPEDAAQSAVVPHPAPLLRQAEQRFGLGKDDLRAEADFYAEVHTPDGIVTVLLAEFTSIDPPFAAVTEAEPLFGPRPADVSSPSPKHVACPPLNWNWCVALTP